MISNKKDGVELILNKQRQLKQIKLRKKRKRRFITLISIFIIISIFYLYLTSSISQIKYVNITGIEYFSRNEIMELGDVEENQLYLLTFPSLIKTKIIKDDMINDVIITKNTNRILNIEIIEKRILGYVYTDKPYLLIETGELIELVKDKQNLILHLPLIEGFDIDFLPEIASSLKELTIEMLNNITEIHHHVNTYDENMLKIVMIDGNKVFTSLDSIITVNNYFSIIKSLKINRACIYIDESSKTAYTSQCPELD